MEKYIEHLLEILQEAHTNRPAPRQLFLPEDMEGLEDLIDLEMSLDEEEKTMENIFGVPKLYFPPENRLTDEQIKRVIEGIIELWRVFNYEPVFRAGEFTAREQYTKLVEQWEETHPLFRGTNGTWYIEMYDYMTNWDEQKGCYVEDEDWEINIDELSLDDPPF